MENESILRLKEKVNLQNPIAHNIIRSLIVKHVHVLQPFQLFLYCYKQNLKTRINF